MRCQDDGRTFGGQVGADLLHAALHVAVQRSLLGGGVRAHVDAPGRLQGTLRTLLHGSVERRGRPVPSPVGVAGVLQLHHLRRRCQLCHQLRADFQVRARDIAFRRKMNLLTLPWFQILQAVPQRRRQLLWSVLRLRRFRVPDTLQSHSGVLRDGWRLSMVRQKEMN